MTKSSDPDDLELFREFVATRQRSTRNQIVERHLGLAVHIAGRFGRSNIPNDDLRQVAMIGLVKAVDRFDPEFGVPFASFAGSTIEGELKRHFRDRDWMVRVPRSAQDLNRSVRRATDELSQDLGRSPTVDEVAAHLDVSRDEVLRGLAASAAHHVDALDSDGGARSAGPLADNEPGYAKNGQPPHSTIGDANPNSSHVCTAGDARPSNDKPIISPIANNRTGTDRAALTRNRRVMSTSSGFSSSSSDTIIGSSAMPHIGQSPGAS